MKGTLIGTDFIYNSDGELVPTEINTGIRHEIPINTDLKGDNFLNNLNDFFQHQQFHQFLQDNGISKIISIDRNGGYHKIFEAFSEYYGYTHESVIIEQNQITIPDVDDDDTTLVLRIAYDSYSIVDDLYCRDMFEFFNLIKDEDFAIPVKFKDSLELDTINEFRDYLDNSVPNYVVKARTPGYEAHLYPKSYRLDTTEELQDLKNQIGDDEFLQEYLWNQSKLVNDRTNFIRSVDLIWGDNLDILPLFSYKSINSIAITNEKLVYDYEVDSNKKLDDLFASKYYPTWFSKTALTYHYDETDNILLGDGTLKKAIDLSADSDVVLGIKFNDDITYMEPQPLSVLQNYTTKPTEISGITENTKPFIFCNVQAYHSEYGTFSWYDGSDTPYLLTRSESPNEFEYGALGSLLNGDIIYIYDKDLDKMIPFTIQSSFFDIKYLNTFLISLGGKNSENKEFAEFFIQITNDDYTEDNSNLFLIQHNTCTSFLCGTTACSGSKASTQCTSCGKNSQGCNDCGGASTVTCG